MKCEEESAGWFRRLLRAGNSSALGRFGRPLLTVCGESDPLVGTKRNQNTLTAHVPGAKGQPHARIDAGHFIQENAGELLAQHLVAFLKSNPLG